MASATKAGITLKEINCKQQEVFSARGIRGVKRARFPGLTKEELPNETSIIKIKGLGLAQNLSPNCSTVVHMMFSQGEGDNDSGVHDDDNENVSISAKVGHFILQKVMIELAKDVRNVDPKCIEDPINDAISDRMQVVLNLDSDTPF